MNELNAIHEPGADQPAPDPSQEGDWPTGTLPSWEGLGVGSWSQCIRKIERGLSMNLRNPATTPAWFNHAVATPGESQFVNVGGCPIHYRRWGKAAKPGLCFVHGGFAHAHWWDWIAPFFSGAFTVVALDLGGMGDSGHRAKYLVDIFAEEVTTVCAHAGLGDSPVLVGHSFGGRVALRTGAQAGARMGGIVLVDFPIRPPEYERERGQQRLTGRTKEIYPNLETALNRFKLLPPQPCDNTFILDYIARRSLAKVKGGWSWKFDPDRKSTRLN